MSRRRMPLLKQKKSRLTQDTTRPHDEAPELKKDQYYAIKKTVMEDIVNPIAGDTEDMIIASGYGIACTASAFPSALCVM